MGLSTAERNRRKRERKKREKEQRRKEETESLSRAADGKDVVEEKKSEDEVEIEYVVEPAAMPSTEETHHASGVPDGLPPAMGATEIQQQAESMESVLRRFHQRAAVSTAVVSDDERKLQDNEPSAAAGSSDEEEDDDDDDEGKKPMSKRKLRELLRPSVAELKRRVKRPDLVEAHDITAADPDFLIELKSISGTVPVPRHWGRKRKYLQGKRGFEKPPFKLPDFIVKTGITDIRDTVAEDEAKQTAKQSNRARVNPKMGAMDVDYKTLYEAFFRYQTKPTDLTKFGDLYYEGRELETSTDRKPGGPFSKALREALGMISDTVPPPWLVNMQRYGPPPSYPHLAIPGLNAPLPNDRCQYGYHAGGWGKPPVDAYGRPLYGGNPFDPPGSGRKDNDANTTIVTSDGKPLGKSPWGSLPTGVEDGDDDSDVGESSEEESSVEDMDESDAEDEEAGDGIESVLPPPPTATATAPGDLRKQTAGDETPMVDAGPKQLYQVLQTKEVEQQGGVFQGQTKYVLGGSSAVPEGAESVLSKAMAPHETAKRKRKHEDDADEDLAKNFKF